MRRREFISVLGSAVATWPFAARAQPAMPVIGFLNSTSPEVYVPYVSAFRQSLHDQGYIEGRNISIEFRWARGKFDRLPELVADLVDRRVTLIIVSGYTPGALAAKAATTTIPIVFSVGSDPVQSGIVSSLNRPGGNITGFTNINGTLGPKRLALLHELLPNVGTIGVLINPTNDTQSQDLREAANDLNLRTVFFPVKTAADLESAFASLDWEKVGALLLTDDVFFNGQRSQIVELASAHSVPAMYANRDFVLIGGLTSYGSDLIDIYRKVGVYAARILKGEKPGDLPVQQPTKFELIINLKTVKTLGLTLPPTLLARADEVIE